SDYGGATQDRKSTTGGCQFFGRSLISWQCKKQIIVATSTTEAEYVAAASGCGQVEQAMRGSIKGNHIIYTTFFWSTARVETSDEGTNIIATVDDKPASPLGDDSQGEACPTVSSLEAEQDRENILKTSTLPRDSPPMVTSLAADEGSMQQKLNELTDLCARLQRQQTKMASKIAAQDLELTSLKAMIKLLKDKDGVVADPSGEDTRIKGRSLETGEEAGIERSTDKRSNEVATVSIPHAGEIPTVSVPTSSGVVPTASPIFTTTTMATPCSRRKGKEKMVESETPKKKKLQEQMDVQMARQLEEEMERDAQRMNEQIARDDEIARIHAEEEL
nr:putative ribonuclease H-like domain-containing protein [Tanacetum cinerariifolium]